MKTAIATLPTEKEKRVKFNCTKCNRLTSGFAGTKRVEQKLCRDCFGTKIDRRPKELNDLSGAEWARYSLSVQEYPDVRSEKQRQHGACFPVSLACQYIQKYTRKGDIVLDPFAGIGTTHDACIKLNRHCIGFDINEEFCKIAWRDFPKDSELKYKIWADDAVHLDRYVEPESIHFVLTSPPYGSLLKSVGGAFAYKWKEHSGLASISNPKPYSDKEGDLGNMGYAEFFERLDLIMKKLHLSLKSDRYMAWVVKDYRDLKSGVPYVNFHGDVIARACQNGFELWDIVIYDQTKFRPLVCLGYPSKRYYHNIGHSYILIFRKASR
ncbi:MAG TPA: site-specific DNA-methyltransferase [Methanocellales archaeon]|nr:site-specific DNA-methyltransferase [Methanocellales archaeon]